ncbi:MAG TPA: O-antigen ligase family protein [Desulfobacteraceae bacterium]|nr:O-antigen ligase family protein [Desulfobacteraceae bacterium]HPJ67668.1 O-antigen ligase family protein [Desulfobacteraceae bacterium]HPQ27800.1 O-antigen ligase family protein [Desulfobacteraceae bacterium]
MKRKQSGVDYNLYTPRITVPIALLLVFVICTFFPKIYSFLPILGKIRIVLLAGIGLLLTFMATNKNYHNPTAHKNPICKAWVAFLLVMLLGVLYSPDRGLTQNTFIAAAKIFLIFFIMIKIADNYRRLDVILAMFGACGVGMGLFATIGRQVIGEYRSIALETGLFGDPNDLGLLLNSTLPFVLFFYLTGRYKRIALIGMVIIVIAIISTFSRGAFLGLCVMGLAFSVMVGRMMKRYILLAVLAFVLIFVFAPESHMERMATIVNWETSKYGMTQRRIDAWKIGFMEGLKNPILGNGAGTSVYTMGRMSRDWHVMHNSPLQVFMEMGLIGLFIYGLLFYFPYRFYKYITKRKDEFSSEELLRFKTTLLALIGFGVTSFFLPQGYSPILFMLSGFLVIESELMIGRLDREHNQLSPQHAS